MKQIKKMSVITSLAFILVGCNLEFTAVSDELGFSHAGGLYEEEFLLELTTTIPEGTIYYTLDGSDPTAESLQYVDGITIANRTEEDNLLSAIVIPNSGGMPGFEGGDFGGEMPGFGDGEFPEGLAGGMPGFGDGEFSEGLEGEMPGFGDGEFPEGLAGEMPEFGGGEGLEGFEREFPEGFEGELPAVEGGEFPEDFEGELPAIGGQERRGGFGGGSSGSSEADIPEENVFKGTVVKAAVFSETGALLSDIGVESYFVSEDIFERYGDLPLVSLVTDADHLFDEETGIYLNYNEKGSDWEREVAFTLYEADGSEAISLKMGMRINGNSTRSNTQKSLRFYAKSSYDEENPTLEYELFEDLTTAYSGESLTSFKRLILRNSGQDNSGTLFREALQQDLVSNLNVDTQASQASVVFINGEFWGIYNLRERYDKYYFASHYGVDAEDVAILEIALNNSNPEVDTGDESDLEFYNEMYDFFANHSLADEANYQKAQNYLDIANFIDYYIVNIYSANTDWPGNNNVFWRYKTENGGFDESAEGDLDGRFRWVLKDMDFGFGNMSSAEANTLAHALNEGTSLGGGRGIGFSTQSSTLFFRQLLENDSFKEAFINRFCDVMNTNYDLDTVIAKVNEMAATIEPAIEEQANRYSSSVSSSESWEEQVQKVLEFAKERTGYMQQILAERFELAHVVTVTLNTASDEGYIRINETDVNSATSGVSDADSWSGDYFAGTTQQLTAISLEGSTFVKFVVTDQESQTVTEYIDEVIEVTLGGEGIFVEAVFE